MDTVVAFFVKAVHVRATGPGVVEFRHGPDTDAYWFEAHDQDGLIVQVDTDFNVLWNGDEGECKTRLRGVLVETIVPAVNPV